MDFSWIIPKFGTYICLLVPYNSANFQLDQSMNSQVTAVFVLAQKKLKTLVSCMSEMTGTIFFKLAM